MLLQDCIFSSKGFRNFTPQVVKHIDFAVAIVYNWLPKIVEFPQIIHRFHCCNEHLFQVFRQQIVFGIVHN